MKNGLHAGDLFVSRSKGVLPNLMRAVQWFWSQDNDAPYNHAGVIINHKGDTLEARWPTYNKYTLDQRVGDRVFIARHLAMTKTRFIQGYDAVKGDIGKLYPVWRLLPLALRLGKFFAWGCGVCHEQTGKFMAGAGFKNIIYGMTPDDLVDKWKIDRDMVIIFEGVLTKEILNLLKEGML
jgi:hypothetical protein